MDNEYRNRLTTEIMSSVIAASHSEDAGVPVLRTGEVFDALMTVMASILTTSAETSSPTTTRYTCDAFARTLQRKIAILRSVGGFPFRVVDAASLHGSDNARH